MQDLQVIAEPTVAAAALEPIRVQVLAQPGSASSVGAGSAYCVSGSTTTCGPKEGHGLVVQVGGASAAARRSDSCRPARRHTSSPQK